jgi:hypothetical protein
MDGPRPLPPAAAAAASASARLPDVHATADLLLELRSMHRWLLLLSTKNNYKRLRLKVT